MAATDDRKLGFRVGLANYPAASSRQITLITWNNQLLHSTYLHLTNTMSSLPKTLLVSIDDLAQMIDHSLLHPTMTDDDVRSGLEVSKKYGVATGMSLVSPKAH